MIADFRVKSKWSSAQIAAPPNPLAHAATATTSASLFPDAAWVPAVGAACRPPAHVDAAKDVLGAEAGVAVYRCAGAVFHGIGVH